MGVMTGIAGQCFLTGDETSGLPKPVGGAADDFKLVIMRAARMIKRKARQAGPDAGPVDYYHRGHRVR